MGDDYPQLTERVDGKEGNRYPGFHIVPLLALSIGSFFLYYQAHSQCDFFDRQFSSYDVKYDFLVAERQFISLWSYQSADGDGGCIWYNPATTLIDPLWKVARSFSVVAGGLGVISIVTLLLSACTNFSLPKWYFLTIMVTINTAAEGLTLLLRRSAICNSSHGVCGFARGSYYACGAILGWGVTCIYLIWLTFRKRERNIQDNPADNDTVVTGDLEDASL